MKKSDEVIETERQIALSEAALEKEKIALAIQDFIFKQKLQGLKR